jgi:taurine dioxygenase
VPTTTTGLTITPLTSVIGAEVSGVDLSQPLDPPTLGAVRQALLDHLVLFFRGQALTAEQHLRFSEQFGPVIPGVAKRTADEVPGVTVLDQVAPRDQGTDTWHSDHLFTPEPPMATILRAVQLPSVGGDTCFASMYAAYEELTPPMQDLLDGLTAVNSPAPVIARVQNFGVYETDIVKEMHPPTVHPVVRVHPETGRKALWVCGNFTTRIVELSEIESRGLLAFLFEHIKSPQIQCRFHWEPNSVAFWDNRAVQHCGVPDYNERRVMQRTMVAGGPVEGPCPN